MWTNTVHPLSVLMGLGIGLAINVQWEGAVTIPPFFFLAPMSASSSRSTASPIRSDDETMPSPSSSPSRLSNQNKTKTKAKPTLKQYNNQRRLLQVQKSLKRSKEQGGGLHIFSDFITDVDMLQELAIPTLWQLCAEDYFDTKNVINSTNTKQGSRRGWLDFGATPDNLWEELSVQIWEHHPSVQTASPTTGTFAGYEYWCNILQPTNHLNWHVDKDEDAYQKACKDPTVGNPDAAAPNPYVGAVYYGYPHRLRGGYLEILSGQDAQIMDQPQEYYEQQMIQMAAAVAANSNGDDKDEILFTPHIERIEPIYNRLIWLNVSHWHRVAPITAGARFTFAVNLWKTKPNLLFDEEDDEE